MIPKSRMQKILDDRMKKYIGVVYGNRTILEYSHHDKHHKPHFMVMCSCGNKYIAPLSGMKYSKHKRCPKCCNKKYDNLNQRIYNISTGILERCNSEKYVGYRYYGGRGIKCNLGETVEEVYSSLLSIDGYFDNAEIDRIDNSGHYELGNLRWVTSSENKHNQGMNSRNTSGIKGVSYQKSSNKWAGYMNVNKVNMIKLFDTFEEACLYRKELEDNYKKSKEII
ncbi:MAG: hypothetical protein ACRCX2_37150 [Paraclostridium sp.]